MSEPYNKISGRAGAQPVDFPGSAIDSAVSRLESLVNALTHITSRVEQIGNSTIGSQPTPVPNQKIDHPPCTLQEWISHLEDKITALDHQVARFF